MLLNLGEVFTQENYPFAAQEALEQGVVVVRLTVGRDGLAKFCTVVRPNPPGLLGEGTCALFIRKARFKPGVNLKGEAVEAEYVRQVRWNLEDNDPIPLVGGTHRVVYRFDDAGKVLECKVEKSSTVGDSEYDPRLCDELSTWASELAGTAPPFVEWSKLVMVLETRFSVTGKPEWGGIGQGPGFLLLDRSMVELKIDPAGRVVACSTLHGGITSGEDMAAFCKVHVGVRYLPAPDGRERSAHRTDATYLRPITYRPNDR